MEKKGSKSKGSKMGRPSKGARRQILARFPAELADALDAYLEHFNGEHGVRTERTAHIETAVREYLERRQFWPPT